MPLTLEFRLFAFRGDVIAVYPYWEEGEYGQIDDPLREFGGGPEQLPHSRHHPTQGRLLDGRGVWRW